MYPSSCLKLLESARSEKGFISHETFGKTHRYFPLISKEEYQKTIVNDVLGKYFDNSYLKMISFFAKEEKISEAELQKILNQIKKQKK